MEVAWPAGAGGVRDSKNTSGPALLFARAQLAGFIADLRTGGFGPDQAE